MIGIAARGRPRQGGGRISHQPLEQRDRTRRGGNGLPRILSEPQTELQHIKGFIGASPFRQFIKPGSPELRTPQAIGLLSGKGLRNRAIRPFNAAPTGLPLRSLIAPMHRQKTRDTLDHHIPYIGLGFPDQRDAAHRVIGKGFQSQGHAPHPFGTRAGFARPAPAQDQPDRPGQTGLRDIGRALVGTRPTQPI